MQRVRYYLLMLFVLDSHSDKKKTKMKKDVKKTQTINI